MTHRICVGEKVIGSTGSGRYGTRQFTGLYLGKDRDGYHMLAVDGIGGNIPCVKIRRFDDPFNRITWELPRDYIKECANGLYKGGLI